MSLSDLIKEHGVEWLNSASMTAQEHNMKKGMNLAERMRFEQERMRVKAAYGLYKQQLAQSNLTSQIQSLQQANPGPQFNPINFGGFGGFG